MNFHYINYSSFFHYTSNKIISYIVKLNKYSFVIKSRFLLSGRTEKTNKFFNLAKFKIFLYVFHQKMVSNKLSKRRSSLKYGINQGFLVCMISRKSGLLPAIKQMVQGTEFCFSFKSGVKQRGVIFLELPCRIKNEIICHALSS